MTDIVYQVIIQLTSVTAAVWGLTNAFESVAKRRELNWFSKPLCALALGPILGMGAFKLGFLTTLPITEGWKGLGGAAFAGLIAVGASNIFADLIKAGRATFSKGA